MKVLGSYLSWFSSFIRSSRDSFVSSDENACVHSKPLQSCPTLWEPMGSSPPGCSVHGILQARILEWVAMPSSRGSSQGLNLRLPCLLRMRIVNTNTSWEAQRMYCLYLPLSMTSFPMSKSPSWLSTVEENTYWLKAGCLLGLGFGAHRWIKQSSDPQRVHSWRNVIISIVFIYKYVYTYTWKNITSFLHYIQ